MKVINLMREFSWVAFLKGAFFVFVLNFSTFGQNAPTYIDWVRPGQTYLQIKVGRDGVYRLPTSLLSQHFPNLGTLNAAGFQLFRRGIEQAILVKTGTDNFLNDNDYIDFVGLMNDGLGELEMYQKPITASNVYRSFYDDTAHYFLTYTPTLGGKRVVDNGFNNNSSVPFEDYAWRTASFFKSDRYFQGKGVRSTHSSFFTPGEGLVGLEYSSEPSSTPDNPGFGNKLGVIDNLYTAVSGINNQYLQGPNPILEIYQVGRVDLNHKIEVYLSTSLTRLDTFRFTGVGGYIWKKEFPGNLVENGKLQIWPVARGKTNVATAYARVKYPATFQMPNGFVNQIFELPVNPNNYSRVRFENIGAIPELYDISNPTQPIKVGVSSLGGNFIAGIENTAISRSFMIHNQAFVVSTTMVEPVVFTNINPLAFDYIVVSHPVLRKPALGYSDPVQAYVDFRKSPEGGGFKVLLLEMDEVYQRFGYGDRTPLSLRNLGGYFVQNQSKLKGMFLLGKGLVVTLRATPNYWKDNLIPTFGTPPSDNSFALGLGEPGKTVAFPIGRLAARKPEHVVAYLEKVKETEAFKYDNLWKKNVFHISGGLSILEQSAFTGYMRRDFASIITGKYFGAEIGHFNKATNQAIEYINIKKILNSGISLLTLFGHSSTTSPDVEIGFASDPSQGFNNLGRYPTVIVNGCYTGNIYTQEQTLSEDWVLTPQKGALMFWAASDQGFSGLLREHMADFYRTAFGDSVFFGKSMGEIQKETMRRYMSQLSSEPQLDSAFMQQFSLHGDPVLKIFGGSKPDYKTSNQEVFLTEQNATANLPFLKVSTIINNFGRFSGDSLNVRISRRYNDGNTSNFTFRVKPVSYQDTIVFSLPQNETFTYFGNNRIEVFLDFLNTENEINESNNIGVIEFFLPSTGILPLFPKDYAIVNSRSVKLTVQATDFFSPGRRYQFQIDTSVYFNSALFAQSPPVVAGNLCSWNYSLPIDKDSTVYFWRVKFLDQVSASDSTWYNRSFEYIKNSKPGWAQSQFFQFRKSEDIGIEKNYQKRLWEFPFKSVKIDIQISGGGKNSPKIFNCALNDVPLLNARLNSSNCYQPGVARLCAINLDRCSLLPKFKNFFDPNLFFFSGCGREPSGVNYFQFGSDLGTFKAHFKSYINNVVQEGDYVALFPLDSMVFPIDTFHKYMADVGPLIGIEPDSIFKIKAGDPYIFIGRKTNLPSPGAATMILPQRNDVVRTTNQVISTTKVVSTNCTSGEVVSTKIGPASAWFTLYNNLKNIENPVKDDYYLQVKGISLSGKDTILVKRVPQFPFDLSFINADSFPFLQLKAFTADTANYTPVSIKRWMVTFDGVPEGVINTSVFSKDEYKRPELQEGDSIGYNFAFSNISEKDFKDSVKVQFTFNGNKVTYQNIGKLPIDSTVRFSFPKISTLGKSGNNQILAFVNPRIQPEEYYDNNALNLAFKVANDKVQPILDVTFDGVKIMNGDFVSPDPVISIVLKDENKFLLKGDTSGMTVLITRPCAGCSPERIALNSPYIKVFPAGKDNAFRMEYRPARLDNGNYRIAVQGADVKGNESSTNFYQVDFQVLDQKTITNFFPYPNPFSTSCQWVFTLTGDFPEDFKIQIMTITGKVVREITKAELGPLRIGNNISQYRWDATDEFGDRLANGVYLYRVVMKEPSVFAQRETAADNTFKKGFGKLYIIR